MGQNPLNLLRAAIKVRKLDAILISQPENRRYLSGYTATDHSIAESSGVLLVSVHDMPLLLTDSRYALQAEAEAFGFEVMLYDRGMLALLKKVLKKRGVCRLGFESHYFLHATALKLARVAEKVGTELVPLTGLVEKFRQGKDVDELEKIRASVRLNEEVFQEVYASLRVGMTERQVALAIETTMRKKGASAPSFETIVAAGPNGALPHAVPSDRPLQTGEPIIIDMGTVLNGYCSDMTRTVVLGEPDLKTRDLIRVVRRAQLAATAKIRAGITGREADRAAREIIKQAGYGKNFGHGLGHGVGLAVHEAPSLSSRNRKKLRAGMVVTIEPGIYLPGWGGIRLENMAVVTTDGCEILNADHTFLDI
ncbi:MAG: Xaa-Pro peptidase family protein [Proteobacteria bacterium]|nr:Xaa-Pro peptidase family protein [Pseudomonadota bacterium]MBU1716831.1 Xaa-Pro peptidase family protein [Pseudomonadota bacterium]